MVFQYPQAKKNMANYLDHDSSSHNFNSNNDFPLSLKRRNTSKEECMWENNTILGLALQVLKGGLQNRGTLPKLSAKDIQKAEIQQNPYPELTLLPWDWGSWQTKPRSGHRRTAVNMQCQKLQESPVLHGMKHYRTLTIWFQNHKTIIKARVFITWEMILLEM